MIMERSWHAYSMEAFVRISTVVVLVIVCQCDWQSAAHADDSIDFMRDIQPLLTQHCTRCHGGVKRAGGMLLLPAGGMPATGDSGKSPLVTGKPDESELFRRLTSTDADERMPAESPPLASEDIAKVRRWIQEGAQWPRHWSLRPVKAINVPDLSNANSVRTAIDCFVLARLKANKIAPSPEADRYTLIRRLSLDLLGLQPSPAQADAFVAEEAPDAYERLIDRLLANPHFGERWGRHWLDLARYADSDGY